MRNADRSVDDTQIVVNLSDGSDRGSRRTRRCFLLNGDGGGKPFDHVYFRTFHLIEKLASVGRKRLHIASLPFGIYRVKGQRRLARTGKPGNDGERVARDFDADVFEIVLASAANDEFGQTHIAKAPSAGACLLRRTAATLGPEETLTIAVQVGTGQERALG